MKKEQSLKAKPKWRDRFDKIFAEIISMKLKHMMVYDAETETRASSRPLSLFLEEFIETVYNEGFRDGKESKNLRNEESNPKI